MKQKSVVWNFFTKSLDNKFATCDICNRRFNYLFSTTNLISHLRRAHPKDLRERTQFDQSLVSEIKQESKYVRPEIQTMKPVRPTKRSYVWKYFKKSLDNKFVECMICRKSFKFFQSTTNLNTHLLRKHPGFAARNDIKSEAKSEVSEENPIDYEDSDEHAESAQTQSSQVKNKPSVAWNFFKKTSLDTARCQLCNSCFKYFKNTSNLTKHLLRMHPVEYACENGDLLSAESGAPIPRKVFLRPKTSIVWKFFKKFPDNQYVRCNLCQKDLKFSTNTSNQIDHLRRMHPVEFENESASRDAEYEENINQEDVLAEYQLEEQSEIGEFFSAYTTAPNQELDNQACPQETIIIKSEFKTIKPINKTGEVESEVQSPEYYQPDDQPETYEKLSETEISELDLCVVEMIVSGYHPLSLVENPGFRRYTQKLNPLYTPPDKNQLMTILPQIYTESVTKLKQALDSVPDISISTDVWNSDKCYVTVTAHFIREARLCSRVLSTREVIGLPSEEKQALALSSVLNEWEIYDKIVAIVTNNDESIKNAISSHVKKPNHVCIAHTLDANVDGVLLENKIQSVVQKCRGIAEHFKNNPEACEKLKNTQYEMNLPVLEVKGSAGLGWSSVLVMLERFLEIKDALLTGGVIADLSEEKETLTDEYWSIISDCVPLLKPFQLIINEMSAKKYPTISFIIPLTRALERMYEEISPETIAGKDLKTSLQETVNGYLLKLEENKTVAMATFLDPRFKTTAFKSEYNAGCAEHWVLEELSTLLNEEQDRLPVQQESEVPQVETSSTPGPSQVSLWAEFDSRVAEANAHSSQISDAVLIVRQYLQMPHMDRKKNPLDFWKASNPVFPKLHVLARKYLCVPATSVRSDVAISEDDRALNERRNRLPPQYLNQIIFLNFSDEEL